MKKSKAEFYAHAFEILDAFAPALLEVCPSEEKVYASLEALMYVLAQALISAYQDGFEEAMSEEEKQPVALNLH